MIAPEMRGPDDLRRRGPFFTNRDPEMKMGRAYLLYQALPVASDRTDPKRSHVEVYHL